MLNKRMSKILALLTIVFLLLAFLFTFTVFEDGSYSSFLGISGCLPYHFCDNLVEFLDINEHGSLDIELYYDPHHAGFLCRLYFDHYVCFTLPSDDSLPFPYTLFNFDN